METEHRINPENAKEYVNEYESKLNEYLLTKKRIDFLNYVVKKFMVNEKADMFRIYDGGYIALTKPFSMWNYFELRFDIFFGLSHRRNKHIENSMLAYVKEEFVLIESELSKLDQMKIDLMETENDVDTVQEYADELARKMIEYSLLKDQLDVLDCAIRNLWEIIFGK